MSKHVWVETNDVGAPIRIFRNRKAAFAFGREWIAQWERSAAVQWIRRSVFYRSEGYCEFCGDVLTEKTGHMHEQQHRGHGGEISLDNSFFLCSTCHRRAHDDRETKFTRRKS